MIERNATLEIAELLGEFPAVGILGARQVGKTTLAQQLATQLKRDFVYLDLESPGDLFALTEPELFFAAHAGKLVILDEVQRAPGLFPVLRGVIDRRRKEGARAGQFMLLGSASLDLLRHSSESLAGRVAYKYLSGFTANEIAPSVADGQNGLWLRGGFPDSFLAATDAASFRWRSNFITTYLEKDIPQLGPRIPAVTLRRLWTMLAHGQGGILNYAQLAAGLALAGPTVRRYVELLEDLFLIRTLQPWSGNIGKRLVRAPKCYVRDSGVLHALLHISRTEDLLSHPVVGPSWEGFVVENILSGLPAETLPFYYRTAAGAEIDLVLQNGRGTTTAIEIKRSLTPKPQKGFYSGCKDLQATRKIVVYPGTEKMLLKEEVEVMPLRAVLAEAQTGFL